MNLPETASIVHRDTGGRITQGFALSVRVLTKEPEPWDHRLVSGRNLPITSILPGRINLRDLFKEDPLNAVYQRLVESADPELESVTAMVSVPLGGESGLEQPLIQLIASSYGDRYALMMIRNGRMNLPWSIILGQQAIMQVEAGVSDFIAVSLKQEYEVDDRSKYTFSSSKVSAMLKEDLSPLHFRIEVLGAGI